MECINGRGEELHKSCDFCCTISCLYLFCGTAPDMHKYGAAARGLVVFMALVT